MLYFEDHTYLGFSCSGGSSFDLMTPWTVKIASSTFLSVVDGLNKRQFFRLSTSFISKLSLKYFISCSWYNI